MNFGHICIMHITSFILCYAVISSVWNIKYVAAIGEERLYELRLHNSVSNIWPDDDKLLSLKFSAFRHSFIPLVFSALIWYVNAKTLNYILFFLSLHFAFLKLKLYLSRRKNYKEASEETKPALKPVKTACFSVVILGYINVIILMICLAFRP